MTLTPGATLGPYTIRAELGRGGMGVVYTAHDPRLDRQVAIKVLPPELTRDETAKQRFLQEAKAASALDHPNICTIHEINETDDGQLCLRDGRNTAPLEVRAHTRSDLRCVEVLVVGQQSAAIGTDVDPQPPPRGGITTAPRPSCQSFRSAILRADTMLYE